MQASSPLLSRSADFIVIGGGIAAASVAFWLSRRGRVILLERESQPGYHSTGRSAALFMEGYGPLQVRLLSKASRAFLESPPEGFSEHAVLSPRGAMMVALDDQETALQAHWQAVRELSAGSRLLDAHDTLAQLPVLRRERLLGAVLEPDASDMDVHAIHQGYLRGVRRAGGVLVCDAEVTALRRTDAVWTVRAGGADYQAPVVVNAAGAWCDVVGALAGARPIGLQPKRRSAFIFAPPPGLDIARWPMTAGITEDWYIKPDAGMLLGSPANADPVEPHDVQAEELDIAIAIDRIQSMTTLEIRRPTRVWAGLRSFVADGGLVSGWDPELEGFYWVAAQGGYGIQTSPAMGEISAALVCGEPLPGAMSGLGLSPQMLSVDRLRAGTV